MTITHATADLLILDDVPVAWALLMALPLLGLLTLGIPRAAEEDPTGWFLIFLGLIWALRTMGGVERVQLVFDRPGARVTLRRRSLLGAVELRFPLPEVDRVVLQVPFGGQAAPLARLALLLVGPRPGLVPVSTAFSGGEGVVSAARVANRWLRVEDGDP
jgi:hypothetical protein